MATPFTCGLVLCSYDQTVNIFDIIISTGIYHKSFGYGIVLLQTRFTNQSDNVPMKSPSIHIPLSSRWISAALCADRPPGKAPSGWEPHSVKGCRISGGGGSVQGDVTLNTAESLQLQLNKFYDLWLYTFQRAQAEHWQIKSRGLLQ